MSAYNSAVLPVIRARHTMKITESLLLEQRKHYPSDIELAKLQHAACMVIDDDESARQQLAKALTIATIAPSR
jgi:hypothetical protein